MSLFPVHFIARTSAKSLFVKVVKNSSTGDISTPSSEAVAQKKELHELVFYSPDRPAIVRLYQFGSILGYFILGEILTHKQLVAMAIIILGTTIISFEID
jgi:hypothetical protein